MGFLAFLLIGGVVAWSASRFYPGRAWRKPTFTQFLTLVLSGLLAAGLASYAGQAMGLFQSGQMAEWFSAIVAAWLAGLLVTVIRK